MDHHVRVNYRLVIPLVVGLAIVQALSHHLLQKKMASSLKNARVSMPDILSALLKSSEEDCDNFSSDNDSDRSFENPAENDDSSRYWIAFRPRGIPQETAVESLKGMVHERDLAIAKLKKELYQKAAKNTLAKGKEENQLPKIESHVKETSDVVEQPKPVTKIPVNNAEASAKPFFGHKLVHLDLKGGAPKMVYLLQLIPVLKSWGATGLLVEYEDMFPYDEDLSVLKSPYAYSLSQITDLLSAVKKHDMLFVPLVQTFGHMEFVLKHRKFAHLRHIANMTNAINPTHSDSIPLVKSIVEQMIKVHKSYIKYLHIGGDEVWSLKSCEDCEENAGNVYLKHMIPIIDHVVDKKLTPILWDDMMRTWTVENLKKISSKHVEPMVWGYIPELPVYFPQGMWERYSQAFEKVWIASSFKGAETAYTNFVTIRNRILNHVAWLKINAELSKSSLNVSGIALTGWSRFDHDSTLCELLPATMPSLALCLAVLKEGQMSDELLVSVSQRLGFKDSIILDARAIPPNLEKPDEGKFVGHSIFGAVLRLRRAYNAIQSVEVRLLGWFNERQVIKKTVSNYHLTVSMKRLDSAVYLLKKVKATIKKKLAVFYNDDIIDEWIWDKLDSKLHHVTEIKGQLMKLTKIPAKQTNQESNFSSHVSK